MVRSLVDLLAEHAAQHPERIAYRYLVTGDCDGEVQDISYAQMARRVQAVAAWLQERGLAGSRAVLMHPPSLEFVPDFLGCLAAGVAAVPGVPARGRAQNHRALIRMKHLIADADAKVILGGRELIAAMGQLTEHVPELDGITNLSSQDIPDDAAGSWRHPDINAEDVAYLQYTSGSTSDPRGVMVTHANLLDQMQVLTELWGHTPDAIAEYGQELFVSWLPVYHDLGLIAAVLNTLYLGATATLFSPLHFVQRPARWLTAINRYRPHTSGSPNFGYELCLKHATADLVATLDLSSWKVAFNGAEPVRAATLRRFTETFGCAGFRQEAHYPVWGLAEATLVVTGGSVDTAPRLAHADASSSQTRADDAAIVSCGRPGPGMTVVIVHPKRQEELPEGEVGEIWVGGASVAKGYWRNALATRETFKATLTGHKGRFLRTGDLGFQRDGEVFVTGRMKDLIIIGGANYYPQDLEVSTELSHPALRPGCCAAFCVDGGVDGEQPVLVCEVALDAAGEAEKITDLIRSAIAEDHGLSVHDVVLVQPGTIPKTSSGKIQRRATRTAYLDGTLCLLDAPATR
jgi:acyl-CoA synthetase (AMP-forming)/AMP-acid ligase II